MVVYEIQGLTKQDPGQPQPANQAITLQISAGVYHQLLVVSCPPCETTSITPQV